MARRPLLGACAGSVQEDRRLGRFLLMKGEASRQGAPSPGRAHPRRGRGRQMGVRGSPQKGAGHRTRLHVCRGGDLCSPCKSLPTLCQPTRGKHGIAMAIHDLELDRTMWVPFLCVPFVMPRPGRALTCAPSHSEAAAAHAIAYSGFPPHTPGVHSTLVSPSAALHNPLASFPMRRCPLGSAPPTDSAPFRLVYILQRGTAQPRGFAYPWNYACRCLARRLTWRTSASQCLPPTTRNRMPPGGRPSPSPMAVRRCTYTATCF